MRLQSAIFDLDGTLVDSMPCWNTLAINLLKELGYEPEPGLPDKLRVLSTPNTAAYLKKTYNMTESEPEIIRMIEERIEDFYRNQVEAKPGIPRFLSLLKMEGVWMCVATATDRRLVELALKRTGLSDYFRFILTCPEVGKSKDSPEIFERALRRLRSTLKDTVVFEDSIVAIRTAKEAGFRVAGIYDTTAEADQAEIEAISDYYIRSFEEMFTSETLE